MDLVDGAERYDYDANGNMIVRNKGTEQQTLEWNAENRLTKVKNASGAVIESYAYDADGNRVKEVAGTKTTRTFFPFYVEEQIGSNAPTIIKYYTFNGMTIAMKRGNDLRYLHSDHLGSNSVVTNADGTVHSSQEYCAYGGQRTVTQFGYQCNTTVNALPTDRTYTGQEQDTTGLMYYHARFFDPALGTFVSPDTMVPEPGRVSDYNRFAYTRNNPLRYADPTGHRPDDGCETEGCSPITDLWILANGAYSLVDPQWQPEPDPIDAIAVGVGVNADAWLLGPFGVSGTGGFEILAHTDGDFALFIYGGFGGSVGEGANAKMYISRVRNLPDVEGYEGVFEVTDVTASAGLIGGTAGRFSAPLDEDGAYGDFYGLAPGANLSVSQSVVNYTDPIAKYSKTNGVVVPLLDRLDNWFRGIFSR